MRNPQQWTPTIVASHRRRRVFSSLPGVQDRARASVVGKIDQKLKGLHGEQFLNRHTDRVRQARVECDSPIRLTVTVDARDHGSSERSSSARANLKAGIVEKIAWIFLQAKLPKRRDFRIVRKESGLNEGEWYSWLGSNQRPTDPQSGALPTELQLHATGGSETRDHCRRRFKRNQARDQRKRTHDNACSNPACWESNRRPRPIRSGSRMRRYDRRGYRQAALISPNALSTRAL